MPFTRRQFARSLAFGSAALSLGPPGLLRAQDDQDRDIFASGETPANVFISPCGRPFRAKAGQPYPVGAWFKLADANGDGKLDQAEFVADAMAFFKLLDRDGDGVLSPMEVAFYEQRIAPEVLGMRVEGTSGDFVWPRPRLWKVQAGGSPMGGGGGDSVPGRGNDTEKGAIVPGGEETEDAFPHAKPYDASGKGASPYGFFDEPEPVTAADLNFTGLILKANFLKMANIHFASLDKAGQGYLTLDTLPMTPVQRRLTRGRAKRR
jgi:EF hand